MFRILILMLICQLAVALAAFTLPVIAPAASLALDIPNNFIGYYTSVMLIGATISTLVTSAFVHRYGALRVSQITLIFAGLGLCILPLVTFPYAIFPTFLLSACLIGIAYGPANPASSHLLVRETPTHLRGRVLSIKQAAIPAAGAISGFAMPLIEDAIGWENTSLLAAALCFSLVFLLHPWRRIYDAERNNDAPLIVSGLLNGLLIVKSHKALWLPALASGAYAAVQFCFIALFVTAAVATTNFDLHEVGAALSIGMTVSIGGRVFWGWVADYFKPRKVLGCLGISMGVCAIIPITLGPDWFYFGLIMLSVGFGCSGTSWQGVYLTEVASVVPQNKITEATSGCMTITFLGGLVGPALAAFVTGLLDDITSGFALIGLVAIVFGIAFFMPTKRKTPT